MRWQLNNLTGSSKAPLAFSPPTGYGFDAQGTQHVIYQSLLTGAAQSDGKLHELYWSASDGWRHNPLTDNYGAALADQFSDIAGYAFQGSTQHVDYRGGSPGVVNELYWDGDGWHARQLSQDIGAPQALTGPTGLAAGNDQVIVYRAADSHPLFLWWDNGSWQHLDLTTKGAPLAFTEVTSYAAPPNGTETETTPHVIYVAVGSTLEAGPIFHVWRDSHGNWQVENVTLGLAPLASNSGRPACYVDAAGLQRVYYIGSNGTTSDGLVHLLSRDLAGNWTHAPVSTLGAPAADDSIPLAAYEFPAQGTQHVDYLAKNGRLYDLWWDNRHGWQLEDLLMAALAPTPRGGASSYIFTSQSVTTQHVDYTSEQHEVLELYWTPVPTNPQYVVDVTGDAHADLVGFGDAGVWVAFGSGQGDFKDPLLAIDNFGYSAGGWRVDRHPRFVADVTGDGAGDIVGFGDAGVWVAVSTDNGSFQSPRLAVPNFGYEAGGWRVDRHPRFMADLTGNGRADIVGFGDGGVWTALSCGDGTFEPPRLVLEDFGYVAGGWHVDRHPRLLADIDGDGRMDIVGFGDAGVYAALSNGDGTFRRPTPLLGLDDFGYVAGGWRVDRHPRFVGTIYSTEFSADPKQRAAIVGFGDGGVWIARSNGNGTFQPAQLVIQDFGYTAGGWRVDRHPRLLADLNGDGLMDMVGFGDAGVYAALSLGNGSFERPTPLLGLGDFGYSSGWRVDRNPRFLAEVTGDGRADVVGFADVGVRVSNSLGDGRFGLSWLAAADFGYVPQAW